MAKQITPAQLINSIADAAAALDVAGKELSDAIHAEAKSTIAAEKALRKHKLHIWHESKKANERPPAEDLRDAMAWESMPDQVYANYITNKAKVEAIKGYTRALESSVSARQSLLNMLRAELTAGG